MAMKKTSMIYERFSGRKKDNRGRIKVKKKKQVVFHGTLALCG